MKAKRFGEKAPKGKQKLLTSRLMAYSATAGAALIGAVGMELTTPTMSGANITDITSISPSDSHSVTNANAAVFSFNAGPFELAFKFDNHHDAGAFYAGVFSAMVVNGQIARVISTNALAKNFALGDAVEGASFAGPGKLLGRNGTLSGGRSFTGQFQPGAAANAVASGYIGLKDIKSAGKTYYGWLKVQVKNNANGFINKISFVPTGGVYGAFALKGEGITAGEVAPIPEPSVAALGGLGLLALGAVGVREMRTRRQVTATASI